MKTINVSDELHDLLKVESSNNNVKLATLVNDVLYNYLKGNPLSVTKKEKISHENIFKYSHLKATKNGVLHENEIKKNDLLSIDSIRDNYVTLILPNNDEIIVRYSIINEWFEFDDEFQKMDHSLEKLIEIVCKDLNENRDVFIHRVLLEYTSSYFNKQK